MKKIKSYKFLLLLIIICLLSILLYIFKNKLNDNSPIIDNRVLKKYILENYMRFKEKSDYHGKLMFVREELLESVKALSDNAHVLNGDRRWTFFISDDHRKIYGVFYGKTGKIVTTLEHNKKEWVVVELFAFNHEWKGTKKIEE